jgi:hypothetical protein
MKIFICYNYAGTIIGVRDTLVAAQSVQLCLTVEEWTQTGTAPVVYKREWVQK